MNRKRDAVMKTHIKEGPQIDLSTAKFNSGTKLS